MSINPVLILILNSSWEIISPRGCQVRLMYEVVLME